MEKTEFNNDTPDEPSQQALTNATDLITSNGRHNRHDGDALSSSQQSRTQFEKTDEHYANDETAVVSSSLLDPHPLLIPPPGSRLAFAGANSSTITHRLKSLPTLEDTLLRRAKAPLCLYNYWQYLADVEARPEDLEFWLSLADYEEAYRRHAHLEPPPPLQTAIGGAGTNSSHSIAPFQQPNHASLTRSRGGRHVESGALGQHSTAGNTDSIPGTAHSGSARVTTLFRNRPAVPMDTLDMETQELDSYLSSLSHQTISCANDTQCRIHRQCTDSHCPFTISTHAAAPNAIVTSGGGGGRPTLDAPVRRPAHQTGLRGWFTRMFSGEVSTATAAAAAASSSEEEAAAQHLPLLNQSSSMAHKDSDSHRPGTSDGDIRRFVEQLYFHYFFPGSSSELYISSTMRDEIKERVELQDRRDPELFLPAKRHVYESMRYESYLRFLRERMYHNISRGTAAPRIVLGLTLIFVALTFQFALIFLDVKPKGWRWLPLVGLWPGFIYALAGVSRLDPFMVLLSRYESAPWKFDVVHDPAIRKSHWKMALWVFIISGIVSVVITLVLFLVPGHHL